MNEPSKEPTLPSGEVQVQTLGEVLKLESKITELSSAVQTLSQTMAVHMKQNLEMMRSINEYIGEQMSYRLYRQNLEENNINLQLKQKEIELSFLKKKFDSLSAEKQEDDAESEALRIEREKLRLEVEALKKNLESVRDSRSSTKDKVNTLKLANNTPESGNAKIKNTIILTAIGTLTAAVVTGTLAFVVWLIRFYIQNNP